LCHPLGLQDWPERTIALYDWDTGRLRDLATTSVRSASGRPTILAWLLKYDGKDWQVWTLPSARPKPPRYFPHNPLTRCTDGFLRRQSLASDLQNAYCLSDDKPTQTVSLKDISGICFR